MRALNISCRALTSSNVHLDFQLTNINKKKVITVAILAVLLVICVCLCLYDDSFYGTLGKTNGIWVCDEKKMWLKSDGKNTYHASGFIEIEGIMIEVEANEKRSLKNSNDVIEIKSIENGNETNAEIAFELFGKFSTYEIFNGKVINSKGYIADGEYLILTRINEETFENWLKKNNLR